ncbi:MAG: SMC-Scp complex subunit ScpB [Planctomycetota bacterium]
MANEPITSADAAGSAAEPSDRPIESTSPADGTTDPEHLRNAPHEAGAGEPAEPEPESESEPESEAAPAEPVDLGELAPKVEAALLTSERALTAGKLAEALDLPVSKPIVDAIGRLNEQYADTGRAFRIEQVAGGWRVMTLPEFADVLAALHKTKAQSKLSAAAMETLAIVAYKQPVLRAELESIRGVACGETLRSLMERHLIKIVGRAEEIGRPMLYGTTKQFLEVFGLSSIKDLPKVEELRRGGG